MKWGFVQVGYILSGFLSSGVCLSGVLSSGFLSVYRIKQPCGEQMWLFNALALHSSKAWGRQKNRGQQLMRQKLVIKTCILSLSSYSAQWPSFCYESSDQLIIFSLLADCFIA